MHAVTKINQTILTQQIGSWTVRHIVFFVEMTNKKTKISVKEALKETWGFKPYRELFCIELFSWLAVQVIIKFIIITL